MDFKNSKHHFDGFKNCVNRIDFKKALQADVQPEEAIVKQLLP